MKLITGTANVKKTSKYLYKGLTLEILGIYIEYKNGNGCGVYPDGAREYKVLVPGKYAEKIGANTSVINDKELEDFVLYQEIVLPLDEDESLQLIQFATNCDADMTDKEILDAFIESMKRPHTPPEHDLSTLYTDEEWEAKNANS